jgi:hypothetical protein
MLGWSLCLLQNDIRTGYHLSLMDLPAAVGEVIMNSRPALSVGAQSQSVYPTIAVAG